MLGTSGHLTHHVSLAPDTLLVDDEVVVIVDDELSIREPLRIFLEQQQLVVLEAGTAAECRHLLATHNVALVLLDIGLPDIDGVTLLPEIVGSHPDLGVVMLTGMADLEVAIDCIRKGADDYLSKPVQFQEILVVVRKVLEKRRLIFENRKYQTDLEKAHFRIQMLHQLSLQMNKVYLSTVELDNVLRAILVGITAEEGLRFNRAFLVMFDDDGKTLRGRMAIGSDCREQASRTWIELRDKKLNFQQLVENAKDACSGSDLQVNNIARSINISSSESDHILIRAANERRPILVTAGMTPEPVDRVLLNLLGEDSFVVVPLYSPSRALGVIIADHFVTRQPIGDNLVNALEVFASQASLAIEHSHLYMAMQKKIVELEAITHELDKNKDLLVEAERYSALGQMSAQLVHAIRNPITAIGGSAQMLLKKAEGSEWHEFLEMMVKESVKLESTLADLVDFVSQAELQKERTPLYPLLNTSVMLLQTTMMKYKVHLKFDLPEPGPVPLIDPKQFQQVLLHLVKNAIEAMPEGGTLTIAVQEENGWVSVFVMDTGMGMAESHIDRAADPFFTTKILGSGLGLSLVERVVQAHRGTFSLHRKAEGGMEALVRLPLDG